MSSYRTRGASRARSGYASRKGGISRSPRLKGLFDKVWLCDCAPRLPAEQFTVKKEGKNKGRQFYTCQQDQDKRCGFFIWGDEAKAREAQCVLSNSRNEPHTKDPQEGRNAGRPRVHFENPSTASTSPAGNAGVKRTAQDAGFGEDAGDEAWDWDLTGAEEEQLAKVAEETVARTSSKPRSDDTSLATGVYATPNSERKKPPRKLPWLQDEPATPKKGIIDFFKTPEKSQIGLQTPSSKTPARHDGHSTTTPLPPEPSSPSPSPSNTAVYPTLPQLSPQQTTSPSPSPNSTLTSEILPLLTPHRLPAETLSQITQILHKHEARAEGLRKGRDVSREALRGKESALETARERCRVLEEERRVARMDRGRAVGGRGSGMRQGGIFAAMRAQRPGRGEEWEKVVVGGDDQNDEDEETDDEL